MRDGRNVQVFGNGDRVLGLLYWGPSKFGFGGVSSCGIYQMVCFGEEVLSMACRTQAEFSLKKPFSPIEACVILSRQW